MKKLNCLLQNLAHYELFGKEDVAVSAIEFDSRKINATESETEGFPLYVAQRGTQTDGHQYIAQAIVQGAKVIVCEVLPDELPEQVTFVKVIDGAIALARLANAFYDYPSAKLKLVGITGTNGKTTTVTLLHHLFMNLGYPTGMLSTIENKIENEVISSTHTTPDAVELNRLLNQMVQRGCEYCFMEVSSHSLCQHRVEGLQFAGAVFSNITHDHLDYHKTFMEYIKAKKILFDQLPSTAFALTNLDDKNGMVMVQNTKAKVYTYSLQTMATYKAVVLDNSFEGLQMRIHNHEVLFRLCGIFNAYNLMAIYGTSLLLGLNEEEVLSQMSGLYGAAGRFFMLKNNEGSIAIIDYAHTPDALKNVLSTIKDITQNNVSIVTVVGCGGDRDALKRPLMAEIACQYSNKVILTSDNPRTEEPNAILDDMQKGVPVEKKQNVLIIENRREAIKTACMLLQPQDVLLVAGKGHENYQEINHVKHHFDDAEEVNSFFCNR